MSMGKNGETKVVYFDQWFTSITSIIIDLKKRFGDKVYVIISSENESHAYSQVADKFIYANWKDNTSNRPLEDKYTRWLSSQLVNNNVDIAFLRKYPEFLVKYRDRFAIYGCKVVFDFKNISELDSKSALYEKLKAIDSEERMDELVPFYVTSDNPEEAKDFIKTYENQEKVGICLKFDKEEGGGSFRRIVKPRNLDIYSLRDGWNNNITFDDAIKLVEQAYEQKKVYEKKGSVWVTKEIAERNRIILMNYIFGPEISVDCAKIGDKFIAMCRTKSGRAETISRDEHLESICRKLQAIFDIKGPFNVQFRNEVDEQGTRLKITDLNFRMSGGVYFESAIGCNICAMYIADRFKWNCLEEMLDSYESLTVRTVTHYETAIEIKK